ncbi:MAG: hypothetical protein JSR46_10630 [Verrucomicrobia bacterium]|nr:hypothetical protein [Verrucomicrobiota bacterium]
MASVRMQSSMQNPEQRFLSAVADIGKEIASSQEFRKQLDAIISGESSSINIGNDRDGTVRKLRFFSHEFVVQMKDINLRMQELPAQERHTIYGDAIHVLAIQIEKQQVVYREKIRNGDAQYFASDEILTKVRNGEFTLKGKNGEKKIAIAGTVQADAEAGKAIKEIHIASIAPAVFIEAAKVFNEVATESAEVKEQVEAAKAETAPPPPEASPTESVAVAPKTPKEQKDQEQKDALKRAAEEAALKGFMDAQEKHAESREAKDKKDREERDRKKRIEEDDIARQELKREIRAEAVVKEEVGKAEERTEVRKEEEAEKTPAEPPVESAPEPATEPEKPEETT